MATLSDRLPLNVAGKYYVDATCIDCDQCRVIAPDFFSRSEEGFSFVAKQPVSAEDAALCDEAINACATGSIGSDAE